MKLIKYGSREWHEAQRAGEHGEATVVEDFGDIQTLDWNGEPVQIETREHKNAAND